MDTHMPSILETIYTEDKARERDHSEDIRVTVKKFDDHKFDYKYLRMLERK